MSVQIEEQDEIYNSSCCGTDECQGWHSKEVGIGCEKKEVKSGKERERTDAVDKQKEETAEEKVHGLDQGESEISPYQYFSNKLKNKIRQKCKVAQFKHYHL